MMKKTWPIPLVLLLMAATTTVQAQLIFTTNADDTITITGYNGAGGVVHIPSTTNGLPVVGIGMGAFSGQDGVTSVTIPGSVTSIGWDAFLNCTSLANATLSNGVTSMSRRSRPASA
jgi:hypothetical protein